MNKWFLEASGRKYTAGQKYGGANSLDNDLEKVGGKFDKLIDLVQEKFGYTQQLAKEEFNQRLKEVKTEGE